MNWQQQRIHDREQRMLTSVKLLGEYEQEIIYEDDPQAINKLENKINKLKKQIDNYQSDLNHDGLKQSTQRNLALTMANITFEDMNFVIAAFLRQRINIVEGQENFRPTNPEVKMLKNGLTSNIRLLLDMGLAKANEVRHLIENNAKTNFPDVPDRLKSTLNFEYHKLIEENIQGDDLFIRLHAFSSCQNTDLRWQAAGLAILCYFFETCDVFEP
ncbi:MAG: hypothetical protein LH649_05130 [Pseudanabaena sp. CAN_BIN31]|nr:hypothetical protein [Pseudanabaena sp. CAN_BIN31]